MNTLIAIPSAQPGGLEAALGAHFGHCELYTLVSVENDKVKDVNVVPNVPHEQGGCMAPVQYLSQKGVKKLIAGGMGQRAQQLFAQNNIKVVVGAPEQSAEALASAYFNDTLEAGDNACDH